MYGLRRFPAFYLFWPCWVLMAAPGLSSIVPSGASPEAAVSASSGRWLPSVQSLASGHVVQSLWCTGLVALRQVEPSETRDRTHVPCLGKRDVIHCTTREVLGGRIDNKNTGVGAPCKVVSVVRLLAAALIFAAFLPDCSKISSLTHSHTPSHASFPQTSC